MANETIVQCAICKQPQKVDIQNLNHIIEENNNKHNDKFPAITALKADCEFICADCVNTEEYRNNYFYAKDKPHVALTEKSKVV
ncbi:hypothetical protein Ga0466249_002312 [Sporomusaceae bacterium BoRhaA]|uniref:hypothetical protein n=1 Tax=Pelorhabdus rhamnosifermentans TaxID=2772457 RepID=UPI001C062EDE|nr:hypothetical protein [Pelorhabdus rhamnosifermentans]MBU2701198.1 hypothetical protein [Pelorhabdus rhamnosifermentans]